MQVMEVYSQKQLKKLKETQTKTKRKSPKSHNMTQMISLQRLSRYKPDEMKEGFLLALRHHMELNHRQLRIWFFWPSIKCVISVAAAYVM